MSGKRLIALRDQQPYRFQSVGGGRDQGPFLVPSQDASDFHHLNSYGLLSQKRLPPRESPLVPTHTLYRRKEQSPPAFTRLGTPKLKQPSASYGEKHTTLSPLRGTTTALLSTVSPKRLAGEPGFSIETPSNATISRDSPDGKSPPIEGGIFTQEELVTLL